MALYVLVCHDVPDSSELRKVYRPAHLARLIALNEAGKLIIGGPTPAKHGDTAMTGSVIIADFVDDEAVQAWVAEEPFLLNGVYSHIDIKPFVQVLPEAKQV